MLIRLAVDYALTLVNHVPISEPLMSILEELAPGKIGFHAPEHWGLCMELDSYTV